MSQDVFRDVPDGLTDEARRERERFEARYHARIREIRQIALSILVWGPTLQSSSPVALKRKQIRTKLIELGHNAIFSEEFADVDSDMSLAARESAQAYAADVVIILVEDAPGAVAEVHDFCNNGDLAPKLYAMVPVYYQEGYSGRGAFFELDIAYGGVHWYQDGEIESCNVLSKAISRCEARRGIIARSGGRRW